MADLVLPTGLAEAWKEVRWRELSGSGIEAAPIIANAKTMHARTGERFGKFKRFRLRMYFCRRRSSRAN
jgi:hypothetical protein